MTSSVPVMLLSYKSKKKKQILISNKHHREVTEVTEVG